ncbi:DUF1127 domain-containing protein [Hoeflea sp.]|uniref:DUF1127 domain-containing protein n=1 Tax=Hoeflea sp. TaxID=1940281 RepID=UPI0037480EB0
MSIKKHADTAMSARSGKDQTARAIAAVARAISQCWRVLCHWAERRRQRRHLGALEDHLLKDIGITRAQARREARRWFFE